MNANEVIANRAIEMLGGDRFADDEADPSQRPREHGAEHERHVPDGDSRRRRRGDRERADPRARSGCTTCSTQKADGVGQDHQDRPHAPGRCHAAAAGPGDRRLRPAARAFDRAGRSGPIEAVLELPAGGTAVGTGINTHPEFGRRVAAGPGQGNRHPVRRSGRITSKATPSATASSSATASCGRSPSRCSTSSNNIRWLGSGPRCGFYEVKLPDRQPGSSIMPGKVNPVMCESMMQVAARVMGNDQTIAVQRRDRRPVPAQHHDAGDGARRRSKAFTLLGQRHATRSSISAPIEMEANAEACEASRREEPVDGARA